MTIAPSTQQQDSACPRRPGLFVAQPPLDKGGRPIIKKVLIANRGEIACRVISTCRKLNISSVAIYVTGDQLSRHVEDADEAINIGSIEDATAGNPFLNIKLLVSTALDVGAQAIHPGYGYLSENATFADAVRDAGLILIGPSSRAMSTLGDKRSSKDYLRVHEPSVPLIPGFAGPSEKLDDLQAAAEDLGYPVMIKASAGGGGKGMRIVHEAGRLHEELGRAQSEAQRSFGSADCILEKYIDAAKHVEVQIVGDQHGNVVSLWEREFSVQRRHQKIIEETPCPWLTAEKRRQMCDVAVKIGELLAYEGAGTVEFVVDVKTGRFFFLEVNTTLQVEHPITEKVTGLDIVSLQLYVAAGGRLISLPAVREIPQNGHAIECRLCAEDPQTDFFPQHGLVRLWMPADQVDNCRYEKAMRTGSSISIHFDSLIAKVVVWAPTRPLAIEKMSKWLATQVNRPFRNVQHAFRNQRFDPVGSESLIVTSPDPIHKDGHLICISRGAISAQEQEVQLSPLSIALQATESDNAMTPKSNSAAAEISKRYNAISTTIRQGSFLSSTNRPNKIILEHCELKTIDPAEGSASTSPWLIVKLQATIDGQKIAAFLATESTEAAGLTSSQVGQGRRVLVHLPSIGTQVEYECFDLLTFCESLRSEMEASGGDQGRTVKAPMPCKVLSVNKESGENVKAGEIVMVIESMKMEMSISAAVDGTLEVGASKGDAVDEGSVLCSVL